MEKPPAGLVQKRQGSATEPLRRAVLFFTPLRVIQILGFALVLALVLSFSGTQFFRSLDAPVYDQYLRLQSSPKIDPAVVSIGIDMSSLQAIRPFPWPKRYYAAMTRILREWGAKAIVFNLFFAEGNDKPEENQALLEEFKKTDNLYLPLSFESEGFSGYYYVNQSASAYTALAKGVGHVNYNQDPDRVVRSIYPFVKFNKEIVPHLALRVAYDFLGEPVPTPQTCDLPRDGQSHFLIHWARSWNTASGYYSFVDVLNSYALLSKGKPAAVKPEAFRGKICLIGMTASDFQRTPLNAASPSVSALGNLINTLLTRQYIRVIPPGTFHLVLCALALLTAWVLIPFRSVFSALAVILIAVLWGVASLILFAAAGIWVGVAAPLTIILSFFLIALIISRIQEYKERLYFLSLAARDELTGLYAMRYVSTFLSQALVYSRAFHKPFAVILLDIDDFRKINDLHGYRAGDEVLKKVAEVIQNAIRRKGRAMPDIAGRYGEEQFIVLLVGYNLATVTFGVAERIRKTLAGVRFKAGDAAFGVTVSAGVSVLRRGEKYSEAVVERAQKALLKAKAEGKNQTCIVNE